MNTLSKTKELVRIMHEKGAGVDVPIKEIHDALYGENVFRDSRTMQQYVSGVVSRINKQANGYSIKPGEIKRTLRLVKA